ncbi:MAG: M50 family metallopeptidase [Chloroflexi bacterium]|nr:M50 family metallopeptidase [Chloroflexota bacterium]
MFRRVGWLLIAFFFVLIFTALVHELGHLAAGRMARLKFHLLVIGPIRLNRENGRFQLKWQPGFGLFNGLAASYPETAENLRLRMLLFACGGPIASLLLASAAFWIAWSMRENGRFPTENAWIWETALFAAIVSFLFFLTAMKPGPYQNGHMADGGRILSLLQGAAESERWCALVALHAVNIEGIRPREWDEIAVKQITRLKDHSLDSFSAYKIAYQWALDNNRFEQAEAFLNLALDNRYSWLSGEQIRLRQEKAFLVAQYDSEAEATIDTNLHVSTVNKHHLSSVYYRANATIAFINKDFDNAINYAELGLQLLQKMNLSGEEIAEKERFQQILLDSKSDSIL